MEKSFIILKPDCISKNLAGEVLNRFAKEGFQIKACKMTALDNVILKQHYAHVADKPFFPEIAEFMTSTPVIMLILEGNNAIQRIRDLLGPTDPALAPVNTIRKDLGTDKMRNIAHASDSIEAAKKEIAMFFETDEIFS